MSNPAKRARAHFPTIQITMVSLIVALALQQIDSRPRTPEEAEVIEGRRG